MADEQGGTERGAGNRRQDDRRGSERRAVERRAPPPAWRRPWALVSYGVVGTLLLVLLVRGFSGDDEPAQGAVVDAPPVRPAPEQPSAAAVNAPARDAFGAAGFEQLVIEGEASVGRRVRTELFCEAPATVALRQDVTDVESAVAVLRDEQGRVPAAICQWGARGDARREDFLLLIPHDLADDFAATPVTTDDFRRRRRVMAEVEWVGRSEALALRTAGVLRGVLRS